MRSEDVRCGLKLWSVLRLPAVLLIVSCWMLLSPAAPCVAASGADSSAATPVTSAGDALFDRYAVEVDKLIEATPIEKLAEVRFAAAIPDATLAAWEDEFGKDGRYWELRYFCAITKKPGSPFAPGFGTPADFLREAQKRGVASANTLLLLYPCMQREYDALLEKQPATEKELEQAIAVMQMAEREELALLDAAIALGPDEAWPHYMKAIYWFDLGEMEAGNLELCAGNGLPVNVLPRPWPLPYISKALMNPSLPGNSAVCGAIILAAAEQPFASWGRLSDAFLNTEECCSLDGKLERLNAWHQFGCRVYDSAPDLRICGIKAGANILGPLSYVSRISGDFSSQQQETLQRIRGAITLARKAMSREPAKEDPANDKAFDNPPGSAREAARRGILPAYDSYQTYVRYVTTFSDLKQLSYPGLELAQCLLAYEPMTEEQAKAYREAE